MGRAHEWLSAGSAVFPAMLGGRLNGTRVRRQSEKNTSLRRPFVFLDAENESHTHTRHRYSQPRPAFSLPMCANSHCLASSHIRCIVLSFMPNAFAAPSSVRPTTNLTSTSLHHSGLVSAN